MAVSALLSGHAKSIILTRPAVEAGEKLGFLPGDMKEKVEKYRAEMIEKVVKSSGNSGRIYLPPNWVGHTVKIIKVE